MTFDITSPTNDKIKWLVRLRDRGHRDADGVFVVEGERLYGRAIGAGLEPTMTFVTDPNTRTVGTTVTVAPGILERASYRQRSEGVIAVFPQFETGLHRLDPSDPPLILIAEDIEKPGNLGAMMRTAAAAGADALITVGPEVDPFNPNALRSSTGALFTLPLAVSSWEETAPWLDERGIEVIGTSPGAGVALWSVDLSVPVALVVGAEDMGLSARAASIAGQTVVIPQSKTGVDSLNASVAAGVVLFEAVRQRKSGSVAGRDVGKTVPS